MTSGRPIAAAWIVVHLQSISVRSHSENSNNYLHRSDGANDELI